MDSPEVVDPHPAQVSCLSRHLRRISLEDGVPERMAVAWPGGWPELPALVKIAWAGIESPRHTRIKNGF
jgi:hypothetical protein